MTAPLTITELTGAAEIAKAEWDRLANPPGAPRDPFMSWDFLEALERSGCVGAATGWRPRHLAARSASGALVGLLPLYEKDHSYGEYVFDHAWADALHRAGGLYYPKLQAAAPFTPAAGRRILAPDPSVQQNLIRHAISLTSPRTPSSLHVTFCQEEEAALLAQLGLLRREGVQYHWFNEGYRSFDDFLGALSSSKRKMIRKERQKAQEGLAIRRLTGAQITPADWDHFFKCYMDTGGRKWGRPYLNRAFFAELASRMADQTVLFVAEADGRKIAAALNFLGGDCLYGRYWGRLADVPFLHFELCYYQAIDLAIERGLARVEAGAQGEHKIARGYRPVATHSAHWIAHPGLRDAVADYLSRETPAVIEEIEALAAFTPFKKSDFAAYNAPNEGEDE